MPTLRCTLCALNWPTDDRYKVCPQCDEQTSTISNVEAMPRSEAKSLRAHIEFEKFYQDWDDFQPPERLAPDAADTIC